MNRYRTDRKTWALVLAAGEGRRLRDLTTSALGVCVPKQFCSLRGGPSLLQEALSRARGVVSMSRLCAIVAAQHRCWWKEPLSRLRPSNVIVQPENRGTGHGILLPLLHLFDRDPDALVIILPSDHYVRDESTLIRALSVATGQLQPRSMAILMLGIEPDEPDEELGYILPGRDDGTGTLQVDRFVEKPSASLASALIDGGALWNAFILVARVQALLELYQRRFPTLVTDMRSAVRLGTHQPLSGTLAMAELYARLPVLDFSRDVLDGAEQSLRVLPVPRCGWSDLGSPHRVARVLSSLPSPARRRSAQSSLIAHLNLAVQHQVFHGGP